MTTITTHRELVKLRSRLSKLSVHNWREEYTLQVMGLSGEENERLGILLSRYGKECGCNMGSFMMSLASIGASAYYFTSGGRLHSSSLRHWLWLAIIAAGGALLGKVLGLLYARWRMIRHIDNATLLMTGFNNQPHSKLGEKLSWEESAGKPKNG